MNYCNYKEDGKSVMNYCPTLPNVSVTLKTQQAFRLKSSCLAQRLITKWRRAGQKGQFKLTGIQFWHSSGLATDIRGDFFFLHLPYTRICCIRYVHTTSHTGLQNRTLFYTTNIVCHFPSVRLSALNVNIQRTSHTGALEQRREVTSDSGHVVLLLWNFK